jgi:hypothetical protein
VGPTSQREGERGEERGWRAVELGQAKLGRAEEKGSGPCGGKKEGSWARPHRGKRRGRKA